MIQNYNDGDWTPIKSILFNKIKNSISFNPKNINNINNINYPKNKSNSKKYQENLFKLSIYNKIYPQKLIKYSSSSRNILLSNKKSFVDNKKLNSPNNDFFNKTNDNIFLLFQKNSQEKILPNCKKLRKNLSYVSNNNPYNRKNIELFKRNRLNEIEKRSSYSNKVVKISKLKRIALNNYSILNNFVDASSIINPKSNENEIKKNDFEKNKNIAISNLRNYLKFQLKFVEKKNKNLSFEQKDLSYPKIIDLKKKGVKFFHNFKSLNGESRDLSKKNKKNKIKMTKQYMRDIQILHSLNKIKDKNLINEIKNEYFN